MTSYAGGLSYRAFGGIKGMNYGDGRQVKTDETTWNEDLQADVTETKHYPRSSVLGGKVLTEILDVNLTRTFVYAGATIIAWQWRSFGSESVEWDHKDPSGASVRRGGSGQELDPFGGDAGISAQTEIPDPGPLLSYGSSYSAANPNTTYTVDGMRVTSDDFMRRIDAPYQESIAWVEAAARSSVKKLHSFGVVNYNDELGLHYRHLGSNEQRAIAEALESNGILIRNWLVPDTGSVSSLLSRLPQNPGATQNQALEELVRRSEVDYTFQVARTILSQQNACSDFFGGPESATNILGVLQNSLQLGALSNPHVGISMSVPTPTAANLQPTANGFSYRAPTTATLNTNGIFFNTSMVGEYISNSLAGRLTQIFHEGAHLTITPAGVPRIPNDGFSATVSRMNTSTVLNACRAAINAALANPPRRYPLRPLLP